MKVTRTRTHRFNMSNYEHLEISASIEVEADHASVGVLTTLDERLDELLRDDIERAELATGLDSDNTYLHTWKETTEEKVNGTVFIGQS